MSVRLFSRNLLSFKPAKFDPTELEKICQGSQGQNVSCVLTNPREISLCSKKSYVGADLTFNFFVLINI